MSWRDTYSEALLHTGPIIGGRDYFTERSRTEWNWGLKHGMEQHVTRAIIDGFAGSETPRPTVVDGGAGGAASDEEQWSTFF